jgi:16S rRNA (guanine1207-N2)-methyltransferase
LKHLSSQILERNIEEFSEAERLLILCPPDQDAPVLFKDADIITLDYRVYGSLDEGGCSSLKFGLDDLNKNAYSHVLVYMPKSKTELKLLFDVARYSANESSSIFLVGEKNSGISSGAKQLQNCAEEVYKIDSAKHCQLWQASKVNPLESFSIEDYFEVFSAKVGEIELQLASLPGVFSSGRLDEATEFLLTQEIRRLKDRTLDFGCGCGVIAAFLKKTKPELTVEAIDSSWLALQCASKTFQMNEVKVELYPSDGWRSVEGRVNGVVCNPPFHQGVGTEYATTEGFIKQAYDKLARYAPMYIVANNFLRYPAVIEERFGECRVYAKQNKFNVYYCER